MKKTILALAIAAGLTSFAGNAKADFNYSFTPGYAFGTGWDILSPVTGKVFGSILGNNSIHIYEISASNGDYSSLFNNVTINNLSIIGGQIKGFAQAEDFTGTGATIVLDFDGNQSMYQPTFDDHVYAGNGTSVATVTSVPEPSTYVLFGLGALALVIAYRRTVA